MAVLLANRNLGIRRRATTADAHGDRVGGWGSVEGPWPGRAAMQKDAPIDQIGGRTWDLAADTAMWPVQQRDMVVDVDSGDQWLVTSAQMYTNLQADDVDYVAIVAHSYGGGTRP